MAIALPAIPLIVKFAEIAGIVVSGVATAAGLDKLSNKVETYIQENPEQSQKIFAMIMPEQGIANVLKKSDPLPDGRHATIGWFTSFFNNISIKELIVPSPPIAQ